ncbi:hypothetical protein ACWD6L_00515 [Micromonospora profundi]|uniref:hypothetical protein n=1 Tax=Micromonospora sp. NRRL B-16802 TaxID=1415541 RepID=UPI0006ADF748|nr:hypothetical protein [Micromonospora sp. NRRL B-16802]KOX14876.1 hypothetical protein ADK66_02105 [Micromonospora sp. NRRL B-16802]
MSESAQQRKPDRNVDEPDVLLDIPKVSVDTLRLAVDGLDADLSLRARLANLLHIDAGVRVHLRGVELDVDGVQAEAQLRVRLEQLVALLSKALDTIDNNPQVIEAIGRSAVVAIDDLSRGAEQMTVRVTEGSASAQHSGVRDELRRRSATPGTIARPARPGSDRPGTPDQGRAEATEPAGSRPGERPPTGRGPADRAPEDQGSNGQGSNGQGGNGQGGNGQGGNGQGGGPGGAQAAAQSATQFAEQAGETLLQAGRSVWEAIQGGLAQHRPPDRRD